MTWISLYNKKQLSSTIKTKYTCRCNYRTMQQKLKKCFDQVTYKQNVKHS